MREKEPRKDSEEKRESSEEELLDPVVLERLRKLQEETDRIRAEENSRDVEIEKIKEKMGE